MWGRSPELTPFLCGDFLFQCLEYTTHASKADLMPAGSSCTVQRKIDYRIHDYQHRPRERLRAGQCVTHETHNDHRYITIDNNVKYISRVENSTNTKLFLLLRAVFAVKNSTKNSRNAVDLIEGSSFRWSVSPLVLSSCVPHNKSIRFFFLFSLVVKQVNNLHISPPPCCEFLFVVVNFVRCKMVFFLNT